MQAKCSQRRRTQSGRRGGFTLIELLAVIAIIMVLVGLILSGVAAVRNAARKAKARGEIVALEHAVKAYLNDNGKLPIPDAVQGRPEPDYFAEGSDGEAIVEKLTTTNNPRGIVYLDPQNSTSPGIYKDPWGTPYAFKFDADYNGLIDYYSASGGAGPECIEAAVVVVSYGPNRKKEDPASGDDIVSDAWNNRSQRGR